MNIIAIIGFMTREAKITTYGQDNKKMAQFTVAVQDEYNTERANFIQCKAFGKTAELIEKYCHKGEQHGFTGHITSGKFEKDGNTVYTQDLIIDHITFGRKSAPKTEEEKPSEIPEGFAMLDDDEIPY